MFMNSYWEKFTQDRLTRRRLLKAGAGLSMGAAALTLLNCSGGDDDGGGGDDEGTPVAGGIAKIGMLVDLQSIEPHIFITQHRGTIDQVWEPLTRYDKD